VAHWWIFIDVRRDVLGFAKTQGPLEPTAVSDASQPSVPVPLLFGGAPKGQSQHATDSPRHKDTPGTAPQRSVVYEWPHGTAHRESIYEES
jgi:hypothetical protein